MYLIIDNYDSFTYNLYQIIARIDPEVIVKRNDEITIDEIEKLNPKAIFLSPGPGRPEDAGICVALIQKFAPLIPIFGVCLGLQAIGIAFGAQVVRAGEIMHGKTSFIFHHRKGIYEGMAIPFQAGRYHSLMIDPETLPDVLMKEAETDHGILMGVRHKEYSCFGVQFHPESILTPTGERLITNFMNNIID